jgi:hypothetical protein
MTRPLPPVPSDTILAAVHASQPRRYLGVAMTVMLGFLLTALGVSQGIGPVGQLVLIAVGLGCLWHAQRLWVASRGALYLTEDALLDHTGAVLARMDQVTTVSRGTFAMKPAGGFTLTLSDRLPRLSAPGMWWRAGRRLGVGGVTDRGPARFMAEMIAAKIVQT